VNRAYLVETRYECLRMLRAPGFAIPFLGLPVLLYLLFAVVLFGDAVRADPGAGAYLFCGFTVFGVVGPAMFGFGLVLAQEREQGLLRLKRALPMPPAANLVSRMAMAMLFAALIVVLVSAAAQTLGGLALAPAQLLAIFVVGVLGALPCSALGLVLGAYVSGRAAPAVVNLVYLPMLHLSGLFYPLPPLLRSLAPVWPTHHLHALALAAAGVPSHGSPAVHIAVLAAETLVFGALALRRLAKESA
jgi:ABC-2 type transport system permease protein